MRILLSHVVHRRLTTYARMPRFLNTYTGEFVFLAEVGATPYAILSHTWRPAEEGGEQTFDDIVKLQIECPITNPKPWNDGPPPPVNETFFSHPNLSEKIKRACEVARNAGFCLIWIDSCCIDKRSSAELSEAINSMYTLYRDADVCYVYLADVPDGTDPRDRKSDFWKSRWHTRGWTLQELVAPAYVVFLTHDWNFLGTKTGLASTLEKITGVDAAILLGMKSIGSASVAKRMSWAAERRTVRVEDRAYSLLGIFGVHMSPIYGEGTNAFLRLQEEIIKHIPDQSIFAWGRSRTLLAPSKVADSPWGLTDSTTPNNSGLLAPSPDEFKHVGDVTPVTPSEFAMRIGHRRDGPPPPLHCVFTPQGARIKLMTVPLPPKTALTLGGGYNSSCTACTTAMSRSPFRRLSLLRCQDRHGRLIALPLCCAEEDVGVAENIVIGVHAACGAENWVHSSPRVVRLPTAVLNILDVVPTCFEVSILRHSEEPYQPKARRDGFAKFSKQQQIQPVCPLKHRTSLEIQLAPSCEEELRAVGFRLTPLEFKFRQSKYLKSEVIMTTTLGVNSAAQRHLDNDQRMHVSPVTIKLQLHDNVTGDFINFSIDRLRRPSSPKPADVSFRCPLDDLFGIPDDEHHQSRYNHHCSSSCTIASAEFMIPEYCNVPGTYREGVSMDYVRLLRLKLERSLESAYVQDCDDFVFTVELSEPFVGTAASTKTVSGGTTATSASSNRLADGSQMQASAGPSIMQASPSPSPSGTPPSRHDAMHVSL